MAVEFMDSSKTYYFSFIWVLLGYTSCFASGILLLQPLLKKGRIKLIGINLLFVLIVICALGYIIFSLYLTFLSELNLNWRLYFTISTLLFSAFIFSCFYATSVNNHPKIIFLFLTAIGYLLTCTVGLVVYLFQIKNVILALTVNFSETLVQFCFAFFMMHFYEVMNTENNIDELEV
ncbi:hypothetical protein [Lacinutrix sp. 5H-3-7-4]|uniref:hypothetical protein n=1 Tax=Lacinutrix sp. (strain 5H-3-7-4) TaxID=983544 RepID=UPI00020A365E|nr:hypothetical protein [Lacinutrix sp. 5H-3-7-4]AEH00786.1 hypothetical protein Lacal_0938 [Lacinutrix sp. 5H-3-7-4]